MEFSLLATTEHSLCKTGVRGHEHYCTVYHILHTMAACKDYNGRLKPIRYKGLCGDPEIVEDDSAMTQKVSKLSKIVRSSKRIVIFTGAGISTSCGIPDFRGPNGVWTKELKGDTREPSIQEQENTFDTATPSFTHYAIACLLHAGVFTHVVSQNVDGLHLRSGVPEDKLSELHGNIFKERCEKCGSEYTRDKDVGGMGLNYTGGKCSIESCCGLLRDMAIDWDTELPSTIFSRAHHEIDSADLVICLGTSLRIRPAGNMPLRVATPKVKRGGRVGQLCIVNLQKTHLDKKATVRISHYCDEVMRRLCEALGVELKPLREFKSADIATCYTIRQDSCLHDRGGDTGWDSIPAEDGTAQKRHRKSGMDGKERCESSNGGIQKRRKAFTDEELPGRKGKRRSGGTRTASSEPRAQSELDW